MLEKSILVVAHPDDEILFFSSILNRVDEILFCFLNCESHIEWSEGRKKSLNEYPLKNVSCLGLDESETFFGVDWVNPNTTEYGLTISKGKYPDIRYKENYIHLVEMLGKRLKKFKNVITHNPWGEYGHCEHVQIFRVIQQLQKCLSFNLWYSNYCSNKSFILMLRHISGFDSDYTTLATNRPLGEELKNLYQKNHCWTWYDDWVWFQEESFACNKDLPVEKKEYGHCFPLNMIKVETNYLTQEEKKNHLIRSILLKIGRVRR